MAPVKRRRVDSSNKAPLPPQKPTLLDILDHNSNHPIFDNICSFLPISDLVNLTRTCRQLSSLYQALLPTQWSINRRLHRFVQDPQGFRSQMGKHDALVSGSFAVQFFERLTWKKSDLDIFIEQGSGALAFEQYLCEREGYRFSREGGDEAYHAMSALVKVRTLVMQRADSTEAQVQIVYTTHQPLLEILNGFYTTLVVNLISWNKAYAVYPQPSFLYHKTYLLKPMSDYFGKLLAKYEERGWRSQDVLWPEDEASHGSMGESRRLGDRFTWIISLDTRGVNRCDTPDSVLDYAGFGLGKRKNAALEYYQTDARRFSALTLKYRYIFPENRSEFWFRFLGPRMDRITLMELYKIPSASRSQLIQYAMQDRRERLRLLDDELAQCGIQLPSYDHVIPGWYAEWEKQQASQVEETSAQLHSYRYSMQPSLSFSPSTY